MQSPWFARAHGSRHIKPISGLQSEILVSTAQESRTANRKIGLLGSDLQSYPGLFVTYKVCLTHPAGRSTLGCTYSAGTSSWTYPANTLGVLTLQVLQLQIVLTLQVLQVALTLQVLWVVLTLQVPQVEADVLSGTHHSYLPYRYFRLYLPCRYFR